MSMCLLLATCDRYAACGSSSQYVSVYPRVYLSGDIKRFPANQEIPAMYGT